MKKLTYIPPQIELLEITVEKGFAQSPSNSPSKAGEWDGGTEELTWD